MLMSTYLGVGHGLGNVGLWEATVACTIVGDLFEQGRILVNIPSLDRIQ